MWLLKLKSVLVATDLGETSGPALRAAARVAQLAEAERHLLHETDTPDPAAETRLRA